MQTSLFTKSSSPLATGRQLPQHPKMCLSYILNPSQTGQTVTTVGQLVVPVPAPVHLPKEAVAGSASSHISRVPELLLEGQLSSRACSPSLSIPDISVGLLPYPPSPIPHSSTSPEIPSIASSVSSNSDQPNIDHGSSNGFITCPTMNGRWRESTNLGDHQPIRPPPLSSSAIPPRAFNSSPNSPVANLQSHEIDITPTPLTVIHQPIPQHPYVLNPSSPVGGGEETRPNLVVARKPVEIPSSRSPSPTLSAFTSDTQHSPHDQSPILSPATTPPSSPPPIPPPMADLPNMMEPLQLLPWEGPPPPGLDPRNYREYQRAGVHWMLGQIFGTDI
ncbi:hypothetical protein Clacol_004344 [Clathrus columnatus]|uniref:Uncharacterized protein n=1 Tax=Clathrus columnatus TaxID=1419009 RepID=A0AAV5AAA7_9AGAM|nr:hypothetical protein Clacol_004344 [Clathrus columnatus]